MGTEEIETVDCNQESNTCDVTVHAPGFALVFLTDEALSESESSDAVQTFSTTSVTKLTNTATVELSVLQTSNGQGGKVLKLGSTSRGSSGSGTERARGTVPNKGLYLGVLGTALLFLGISTVEYV